MPKRIVFYVDENIRKDVDALKQKEFYDKPYSYLYRHLLVEGLKAKKGQG